jgi:hypothetical protein
MRFAQPPQSGVKKVWGARAAARLRFEVAVRRLAVLVSYALRVVRAGRLGRVMAIRVPDAALSIRACCIDLGELRALADHAMQPMERSVPTLRGRWRRSEFAVRGEESKKQRRYDEILGTGTDTEPPVAAWTG